MRKNPGYNEGRFSIPPKFDFKIIPFNSKKITIISFIGDCDTCFGDNPYLNISTYSPLHFHHKTSSGAYIDGFHDCEKQIIYLLLNNPTDLKSVLQNLGDRSMEQALLDLDHTYLKLIYYLFSVSHFVVISSVGINLDPNYIRLFRLVDKIMTKMQNTVNSCLRTLHVPRDWICLGRATIPRLLFVFKASVPLVRKLTRDPDSVRTLEQNLSKQIFNTFFETGVISNNNVNDLFMFPGHNFTHVLLSNEYAVDVSGEKSAVPSSACDHNDLAQGFMETVFANLDLSHLLGPDSEAGASACRLPKAQPADKLPLPPPPDQPEEHNLRSFLNMHVATWLEQVAAAAGPGGFGPNQSLTYELPTCKAWFFACYKLYTSLMSDDSEPPSHVDSNDSSSSWSQLSLAQTWQRTLAGLASSGTLSNPAAKNSLLHSGGDETRSNEASQPASLPQPKCPGADTISRLCEMRCRAAMSTAEAHYKQDLPIHYSNTYHLIKLIASFNVFTSHARGSAQMFRSLEQLCQRLTHLYLAGRVTCTALSLTGQPCQHELHRLPNDTEVFRSIRAHMSPAERSSKTFAVDDELTGLSEKPDWQLAEYMIPRGVSGKWRALWLEEAIKQQTDDRTNAQGNEPAPKEDAGTAVDAQNHQEERLTVMRHRSDGVLRSACSCGRQQAERADPFDYIEANWRFYSFMADSCCSRLPSIPIAPQYLLLPNHCFCVPDETPLTGKRKQSDRRLPQPKSSHTSDAGQVAGLVNQMAGLQCSTKRESDTNFSPQRLAKMLFSTEHTELHDAELSQLDEPAVGQTEGEEEENTRGAPAGEEFAASDLFDDSDSSDSLTSALDKCMYNGDACELLMALDGFERSRAQKPCTMKAGLLRVPSSEKRSRKSTTSESSSSEPLITMVPVRFRHGVPTTQWLIGELPLYPSWAIYTLGKYFSYSHYSGLSCRGFLHNSNFLLPWDVYVNPKPWESDRPTGCGSRAVRGARNKDTAKLFIGFEMECPLGHRFFLAGPHRPMDGPMQVAQVRQAVHGLLNKDLPLYYPCRCQRSTSDAPVTDRQAGSSGASVGSGNPATGPCAAGTGDSPDQSSAGSSTGNWAQLTRIYLAIPATPLRVRLQPRVRPGPPASTPVFHIGPTLDQCNSTGLFSSAEPVDSDPELQMAEDSDEDGDDGDVQIPSTWASKPDSRRDRVAGPGENHQTPGFVFLQNSYLWVIRLPFAYHDGTRFYERPKTVEQMNQCKLLRGCIKLQQIWR